MAAKAPAEPEPQPDPPQEAPPELPKFVTVHCGIPQGFVMSFVGRGHRITDEGLTVLTDVHKDFQIKLKAGRNPGIKAADWDRWSAENAEYPAFVSGHIWATED